MRLLACFFICILIASCSRPLARYTADYETVSAPSRIQFQNESENAEEYLWNFGNGKSSEEENPENRYLLSGKYVVELTAIKGKKKNKTKKTIIVNPPEKCLIQLETEYGEMIIELFEDTPEHRENFTKLVEEGYYDGLLFHRVMEGFMIQGGDPKSKGADETERLGSGGPGYQIPAEFKEKYVHVKGALAAARQPDSVNPEKRSSGSQFYIVHGIPTTDAALDQMEYRKGIEYTAEQREAYKKSGGYSPLDGEYTVFGQVIEGMEVIDKIAAVETSSGDRPLENVSMKIKLIK
jgi:peptidyl-prolyl cis-trans isomerase B (cyclophilin B)